MYIYVNYLFIFINVLCPTLFLSKDKNKALLLVHEIQHHGQRCNYLSITFSERQNTLRPLESTHREGIKKHYIMSEEKSKSFTHNHITVVSTLWGDAQQQFLKLCHEAQQAWWWSLQFWMHTWTKSNWKYKRAVFILIICITGGSPSTTSGACTLVWEPSLLYLTCCN